DRGLAAFDQNSQPKPLIRGLLELFDFAEPHAYGEFRAFSDYHFGGARPALHCRLRQLYRRFFSWVKFHLCVPPTVISLIFIVGIPTPTGTLWPSLPHMPTPESSSRSLPTAVTCFNASGPVPLSVAPLTGAVTLPSSIK